MSPCWPRRYAKFAAAVLLLLGQRSIGGELSPGDFTNAKSCKDAVEIVKERLRQEGKADYAALLSEARVREAVGTAVKSYDALLESQEKRNPGSKEYFNKDVKPVSLRVAQQGEWPANCSVFWFYTLTDARGVSYDGLGLRLRIETPKARFTHFALPVVDLYFGRFSGPAD